MQALTASIEYGNFKSAIGSSAQQHSKLAGYHDIHHRMIEWQDEHVPHETQNLRPEPPF